MVMMMTMIVAKGGKKERRGKQESRELKNVVFQWFRFLTIVRRKK